MSSAPGDGQSQGAKALIHLVPRSIEVAQFEARVREAGALLRRCLDRPGAQVNAMFRVADDPLGRRTLFRAALEVVGGDATMASLTSLAKSLEGVLNDAVHVDLSSFLVGEEMTFIDPGNDRPVRYQYLMRRRSTLSHEAYLEHYHEVHSRFGIETPGIEGYAQFRVDLDSSREAAHAAGFGVWSVDSVSELSLASVESFISAVSSSKIGPAATADERTFVDRRHSFDFISNVEWDVS